MAAAAAVGLVTLTAATTLWVVAGGRVEPGVWGPATGVPTAVQSGDLGPGSGEVVPVSRLVEEVEEGYAPAIRELEWLVREGGSVLAPETMEVLEASLAVIDEAIREAREAILADPAGDQLLGVLTGHYQWKVQLLRQMAGLTRAS